MSGGPPAGRRILPSAGSAGLLPERCRRLGSPLQTFAGFENVHMGKRTTGSPILIPDQIQEIEA